MSQCEYTCLSLCKLIFSNMKKIPLYFITKIITVNKIHSVKGKAIRTSYGNEILTTKYNILKQYNKMQSL